ncbi:hypothetical protein Sm713_14580 [Streptomyces sp. TS71-3]|nr:hypothetical protein Sm713_14580 [Streptomyces sp. TS71-3]
MAVLAWLLIPLVAAVGASLWGKWAARQRKVGDGPELAGYARFRAAMEKTALEGAGSVTAGTEDPEPVSTRA